MGFDILSFALGKAAGKNAGGSSETVVFAEQTLGFEYSEGFGAYYAGFNTSPFSLVDGQEYIVVWDGIENKRTAFAFTNPRDGTSCVALGNPLVTGGEANEDKFAVVEDKTNDNAYFFSLETTSSHTVKIYQKASGGSVEGVHFVTFMSEDGTQELYKRPVADGDDCADPVIRGLISEPTKESTAQYNYTHVGWSANPNGALDENILKAVTADKTVYANFAAVLRYYTVTYYDEDGTTVLKTESLAYGTMPSYKPTRDDEDFVNWTPNEPVTGNMNYIANWKAKPKFETASWEEIAAVCNEGNAASTFAVGDKKAVTLTYTDGTSETINFTIVDMGVDPIIDGTKGAITCMADNLPNIGVIKPATAYNKASSNLYSMTNSQAALEKIFAAMPQELQTVIKRYRKFNNEWNPDKTGTNLFCPYCENLGLTAGGSNPGTPQQPNAYRYFSEGASIKRTLLNDSSKDDYWTNSYYASNSSSNYTSYFYVVVDGTTKMDGSGSGTKTTDPTQYSHYILPCFCI